MQVNSLSRVVWDERGCLSNQPLARAGFTAQPPAAGHTHTHPPVWSHPHPGPPPLRLVASLETKRGPGSFSLHSLSLQASHAHPLRDNHLSRQFTYPPSHSLDFLFFPFFPFYDRTLLLSFLLFGYLITSPKSAITSRHLRNSSFTAQPVCPGLTNSGSQLPAQDKDCLRHCYAVGFDHAPAVWKSPKIRAHHLSVLPNENRPKPCRTAQRVVLKESC